MQPGLFFFPLYHTNEAVKDFYVLVTLTVYNRAFPDLDVVNQFLDDFPVKLLHIQIAADDTCPLPDIFNFLSGFPFFCQKSLQPCRLLDALLFAFLNQNSKGIAIDRAADLKIEPQEKSIIDRSVGNIYREYLKSYQGQPPTLKDLYDDLMKQVNPEAHRIALALELFTVGSLNVFSHQTNINTKSRILCFDIQDLGENLKSVGLLVMLDAIYNRVIQNRREGKYTHVYIDEIYLFFANGSGSGHSITNYSSEFLYKCWKRFRKYGATLTGITQNVEECLLSNTARMMFANSEFLLMLNQATTDREQLARLLGASDTQMSYVDNAPAGHGLIKVGGAIVPFANELPKNTELYRLMSTRPGEE